MGVQKTPKFSPFLINWKSASSPEFISQPMPMKFGFSIENTSGQCMLKSISRKSHFGGSKNSEIFAVFGELEIDKLSWVYLSTNANEIWFQPRKHFGPVQVEVYFAKIALGGSSGQKTPIFSPFLVNWKSASCPDFISQPMPMKFGFSIENTSG